MSHIPIPGIDTKPDLPGASRTGLVLFAIYLVIYLGFVLLAAFSSSTMTQRPFAGINLAIIYGFVLIISPLILAVVYLLVAKDAEG